MTISDEAVEAAEKVVLLYIDLQLLEHDPERQIPKEAAREILEAAAPYIAAAWHDAVSEAYVEGSLSADQASIMWNKNPYRSQA